jgi:hypothetical protein
MPARHAAPAHRWASTQDDIAAQADPEVLDREACLALQHVQLAG